MEFSIVGLARVLGEICANLYNQSIYLVHFRL